MTTATKGRRASTQPATAFDYRRHITIVQILSRFKGAELHRALVHVGSRWGVEDKHGRPLVELELWELIEATAKHVTEHKQEELL